MNLEIIYCHVLSAFPSDANLSKIAVVLIGVVVGFLSGLLGKGGSAISTPALQIFAGLPPFVALASPLPATLPTAISASVAYSKEKLINKRVVFFSVLFGTPSTIIGSLLSHKLGGNTLMLLTAVFVFLLGVSFFIKHSAPEPSKEGSIPLLNVSVIAIFIGFLSGLLANSGGILFGPLFIRFLKMPAKHAIASSLAVAAALAIPGTITHWYLGHIDWEIVLLLSLSSIPFSYFGAKLAMHLDNQFLENTFGILLIIFGLFDLWYSIVHS